MLRNADWCRISLYSYQLENLNYETLSGVSESFWGKNAKNK